jgi:CRISPR-associated endonuclease/helicase Cas3
VVVSTQLIEAGVDIDFPAVYRAIGPLDAIIQVAGRADRNGRASSLAGGPAGRVIVFVPEDNRMPGSAYELATGFTIALARDRNIQADDTDSLRDYYDRLYGEQQLGYELSDMRSKLQFATLAEQFEWISDRTRDVFVSYGEGARHVDDLMRMKVLTRELRRKLQRFTVGLQPAEFLAGRRSLIRVGDAEDLWVVSTSAYSVDMGFDVGGNDAPLIV